MTYPKRILPPLKDLKGERVAETDRNRLLQIFLQGV